MEFRKFFTACKFILYAKGDGNWDLYIMQYKDDPVDFVALAKKGSGAMDCFFCSSENYLRQLERRGINHGFVKV